MSGSGRSALSYVMAIGHRAFFAGSSLLLTVVAGRELEALMFAQFALFMATVSLLLIPHASFFSEPMLVYGPKNYVAGLRRYLIALGGSQFAFGLLCALVSLILSFILPGGGYAAFAIVIPLALALDFQVRSFFMQFLQPAAVASAVIQFATLAILLFAGGGGSLDTVSNFLVIYALSLLSANLFLLVAQIARRERLGDASINYPEMFRIHAKFAGWTMLSHLLFFLITNVYIFLLPVLYSAESVSNFRAQSAITGPGVQAFSALGLMAVPVLRVSPDASEFLRRLRTLLLVTTAAGLPVVVAAGLFGAQVIDLIYQGKYQLLPGVYWLAGLYPLTIGYVFMLGSALRAIDRARLVAVSAGSAVVICLPVGIWLTWRYGAEGVIISQVLGSIIMAGCCALAFRKHFSSSIGSAL